LQATVTTPLPSTATVGRQTLRPASETSRAGCQALPSKWTRRTWSPLPVGTSSSKPPAAMRSRTIGLPGWCPTEASQAVPSGGRGVVVGGRAGGETHGALGALGGSLAVQEALGGTVYEVGERDVEGALLGLDAELGGRRRIEADA